MKLKSRKFKNTQLQFQNPGSYKKTKVYSLFWHFAGRSLVIALASSHATYSLFTVIFVLALE